MALLWNGDLAPGNISQWGGIEYKGTQNNNQPPISSQLVVLSQDTSISPTVTPPGGCSFFARFTVHPGDKYGTSSGERCLARQYEPIRMRTNGYESWWVYALLFPTSWNFNMWNTLEWHADGGTLAPMRNEAKQNATMWDVRGGNPNGATVQPDRESVSSLQTKKNVWHVFICHWKHQDTATGIAEIYTGQRGVNAAVALKYSNVNIPTKYTGQNNYAEFGLYGPDDANNTRIVYHAGHREYSTLSEAQSWAATLLGGGGSQPPPPPPPPSPVYFTLAEGKFGKKDGSSALGSVTDYKRGSVFRPAADGLVDSLGAFLDTSGGGAGSEKIKLLMYECDASGAPVTLVATSNERTIAAGAVADDAAVGAFKFSLPATVAVLASKQYLIGDIRGGPSANTIDVKVDALTAAEWLRADTYADNPTPTWDTGPTGSLDGRYDNELAFFAYYTPAGAPAASTLIDDFAGTVLNAQLWIATVG